jgi:hypothetical protein
MTLYIEITTDEALKRYDKKESIYYKADCDNYHICDYLDQFDEYCQYYKPLEVSDDFIKWDGKGKPVNANERVEVILKNGAFYEGIANEFLWSNNIIAYRVIKEAPKQTDLISRLSDYLEMSYCNNPTSDYGKGYKECFDKVKRFIQSEGINE